MKSAKKILSELNTRALTGLPQTISELATQQNPWFTPNDIAEAWSAIRDTMLDEQLLDEWMARYPNLPVGQPQRVLIVMAGNLPFVGMFDLVCTLMAGHHAVVKTSHKDQVLMKWVVDMILDIEPSAPINIYSEGEPVDRIIATGGDAALAHFQSTYADKPALLRGSRHSAAIVTADTSAEEMARLADDIYRYSGLGCRNVSLIFIPEGSPQITIPSERATINHKYLNNYRQTRAIFKLNNKTFDDNGLSLLVEGDQFPAAISVITTIRYRSLSQVEAWLEAHDDELQCVVAASDTIHHPRRVEFGSSQSPSLTDYADGVDTMIFLS